MNTRIPVTRTLPTSSAQLRLAQSRIQIARWLEQDLQAPAASSALDCAVRIALPLLGSLRAHSGTAVVFGAVARAWLRSGRSSPVRESALRPLEVVLSLAGRHPRIILVVVGFIGLALWWWNRSSHHPPSR